MHFEAHLQKTLEGLGDWFSTVTQTLDFVSGSHNCRSVPVRVDAYSGQTQRCRCSQPPACWPKPKRRDERIQTEDFAYSVAIEAMRAALVPKPVEVASAGQTTLASAPSYYDRGTVAVCRGIRGTRSFQSKWWHQCSVTSQKPNPASRRYSHRKSSRVAPHAVQIHLGLRA